jgi:microcystin-dependent protein
MPAHAHAVSANSATVACKNGPGNQQTPEANVPAIESAGVTATYSSAPPNDVMRAGNIALTGTAATTSNAGGLPHENHQPFLTINYCIALQGIYPARS